MVNVIGLGYIGLPTALMLAAHGNEVVGTDYNARLVEQLNHGHTTFSEKGIDELYQTAVQKGIRFCEEYQVTDTYIVSVPTPYDKDSKKIDPGYVVAAVEGILKICPDGATVVIESTVSPGTIDRYIRPLCGEKHIQLVHAPERIIPGNMLYELEHNSRTIGADTPEVGQRIKALYASFCKGEIVLTDIRTAEMTKVIENTYRAVNIAFANELQMLCRDVGLDVSEIIRICNMHPRVNILSPGPGVGGHCIPVDPWFLVGDYPEKTPLIHRALEINDTMPAYVYQRICAVMEQNGLDDFSKVGLYGMTYKEDVDDLRESPGLQLLNLMREKGYSPKTYDPMVAQGTLPEQCGSLAEFLASVDLVVVLVGHQEIRNAQLEHKLVLDTRRVLTGGKVYYL